MKLSRLMKRQCISVLCSVLLIFAGMTLYAPPAAALAPPIFDNFVGTAATALGTYNANWTVAAGAAVIGSDGKSVAWNSATAGVAFRTDVTWTNNQQSSITLSASDITANSQMGPAVRCSAGNNGYAIQNGAFSNTATLSIVKIVAGAFTVLQNYNTIELAPYGSLAGDTYTLAASGTTITAYKNGIPIMSVADATFSSGSAGFYGAGTLGTSRGTGWIGDSLPTTSNAITSVVNTTNGVGVGTWTNLGTISQVGQAVQFTLSGQTYYYGGQIGGQVEIIVVPQFNAPSVLPVFVLEASDGTSGTFFPVIGRINPLSGVLLGSDSPPVYSVVFGVSGLKSATFRFGIASALSLGGNYTVYMCGC